MNPDKPFLNFTVDHMTLLLEPRMYNVAYALFRIVFGCRKEDVLYEKRKRWDKDEASMTFAVAIGEDRSTEPHLRRSIVAVVQPSEPENQPSHVRDMLRHHNAAAHWQHIALRVPDLPAFHNYALERGVNFITPILKDKDEDLIQVFSGEWFFPGAKPSGMFFEFVQRNPTPALLEKIRKMERETWFRDRTFLGLYQEKENEYQSGKVTPFIDFDLFEELHRLLGAKPVWEINEEDLAQAEKLMLAHAKGRPGDSRPTTLPAGRKK